MTLDGQHTPADPVAVRDRVPVRTAGDDRSRVLVALGRMAAVAAAIFATGAAIGLVAVGRHGGGPIQGWDDRVQHWSLGHRAGLVGVSKVIAYVGDAPKLAVVAVLLAAVLWWALRSVVALLPLLAYLGGELQVFAIRQVIHRPRPPTADFPAPGAVPGVHETTFSFPSGHSVAVTAILFALAGAAALGHRRRWPWAAALAGSVVVAGSRLVLGVHWFSDVTFGLLFGICWGVTAAWGVRRLEHADLRAVLHPRRG